MDKKQIYQKPETVVIELEMEGMIANSNFDVSKTPEVSNTQLNAPRRGDWGDLWE